MKLTAFGVFAVVLLSGPMVAGPITQDFNAYGAGTGLAAGNAEYLGLDSLAFADFTLSAPSELQLDAPGYYGATNYELLANDPLTITFNADQIAFSIDLRDFSGFGGSDTISVYAADDVTLLNSYSVTLPSSGSIVSLSDPGESGLIGAVTLGVAGGGSWSGILQDVTYDYSSTPEPASLALVCGGLAIVALLAAFRERKLFSREAAPVNLPLN